MAKRYRVADMLEAGGYKDMVMDKYFGGTGYAWSFRKISMYLRGQGIDVSEQQLNKAVYSWKKEELEECECLKETILHYHRRGESYESISRWLSDEGFVVEKKCNGKRIMKYVRDWIIEELECMGMKEFIINIRRKLKNEDSAVNRIWEYLHGENLYVERDIIKAALRKWTRNRQNRNSYGISYDDIRQFNGRKHPKAPME